MNFKGIIARLKISLKNKMVYRIDFIIDIFLSPVIFLITQVLWTVIYSYNNLTEISGFTLNDNLSYLAISYIIGYFVWTSILNDVGELIQYGNLGGVLLQPQSLLEVQLSEILGKKLPSFFIKAPLTLLLIILIFNINIPISFQSLFFFLISISLSVLIQNLFMFSLGLLTFFEKSYWIFNMLASFLIEVFSGYFMPIDFYPNFLKTIINVLPFKHIFYSPNMIFLNKYSLSQILQTLLIQSIWVIFFYLISKLILKLGRNKFTSQGG